MRREWNRETADTGASKQKLDALVKKLDHERLLLEVRKMNNSSEGLEKVLESTAFPSILDDISRNKSQHKKYVHRRRKEKLNALEKQHQRALLERKIVHYPHQKDWEYSFEVGPDLRASLRRVPDATPLAAPGGAAAPLREADAPPGKPSWKVPDTLAKHSEPPLGTCTPSYQELLCRHLERSVAELRAEYSRRPATTQRLSNLKAQLGADLASMEERRRLAADTFRHTQQAAVAGRRRPLRPHTTAPGGGGGGGPQAWWGGGGSSGAATLAGDGVTAPRGGDRHRQSPRFRPETR